MLQLSFGRVYVSAARRQPKEMTLIKDARYTTRVNGVRKVMDNPLDLQYQL